MPLSWTPPLISLEHVHAEAHVALPERSPAPHLLAASTNTGTLQRRGRAQYLCVDVAVSDKLAQQPGVLIKDAVAFPGLAESLPSGTLSTGGSPAPLEATEPRNINLASSAHRLHLLCVPTRELRVRRRTVANSTNASMRVFHVLLSTRSRTGVLSALSTGSAAGASAAISSADMPH
jgi:hypothetical protein